jgi:predicted RNA-binding protein with RPS1 domain
MTRHVVVDGSNLATEGRSMPSLTQLNEAVLAFMAEHPADTVTVVVDATFGHRIASSEVDEFNEAVANNELVAPPAGAVGRGDAFVLSIANKVGAVVLSNDSFQEFHPEYPWLFDEGRLVGGKPVPHVGWVFVARTPVRGPVSRRATKEAKAKASGKAVVRRSSKAASQPMPVPKEPPPRASFSTSRRSESQEPETAAVTTSAPGDGAAGASAGEWVNDLMPFLDFAQDHPVGSRVQASVESYSSHGAYVTMDGGLRGYVPLRLMGDPQPRSARSVLALGDRVELEVASYNPARRSVDLALVKRLDAPASTPPSETSERSDGAETQPAATSSSRRKTSGRGKASSPDVAQAPGANESRRTSEMPDESSTPRAKKAAAKKAVAKKTAAPKATSTKKVAATKATPKKAPVKAAVVKKTAKAKPEPTKKAAAKKAAPTKAAPATTAAAKKAPATKAPVKKAAEKKTPAKKAAVKKSAAKKAVVKTAVAKKAPAT